MSSKTLEQRLSKFYSISNRRSPSADPSKPTSKPPTTEITNLRLSHTSNNLGVDILYPSLSWSYSTQKHNWKQGLRVILVTFLDLNSREDAQTWSEAAWGAEEHVNVRWPTWMPGVMSHWLYNVEIWVISEEDLNDAASTKKDDESMCFRGGLEVRDRVREYVEGYIRPGTNQENPWVTSKPMFLDGGITTPAEWKAFVKSIKPISTPWDLMDWDKPKAPSVFRNWITLKDKPVLARLHATAFGVYKVYINGKAIGDSIMEPGWTEYKLRLLYQTYDITPHLKEGENVITVIVADGWYRGRLVSGWEARRGIFGNETGFMARIESYGPTGREAVLTTESTELTGWRCTEVCPIKEVEIYDGECFDARVDLESLNELNWKPVQTLDFDLGSGKPALTASTAPPIRHTETIRCQSISTSPDGKKIVDFGQNMAGKIHFRAKAERGTEIEFLHVEVLNKDGSPCDHLLREAKCTDKYIFKGDGVEEWEPEFTFHGFRYVQVHPWIEGMEIVAKAYNSDLPTGVSSFHTGYYLLDRLVQNIQWSARANFFGVPTDCPQRDERLGWSGDINAFAPTATYIFDCQTFLISWLRDLVNSQKLSGTECPGLVAPCALRPPWCYRPTALWQDALFTVPYHLYETYSDKSILEEFYPAMVRYHKLGIPKNPDTGLWKESFQFGDWLDPNAPPEQPDASLTSPMYVADTWLCHVTITLSRIAKIIGKDADYWEKKVIRLKHEWQKLYMLPGRKGRDALLTSDTQTAYSLAINFGLLPVEMISHAVKRLHILVEKNDYHLATGFAGTPELLHAISWSRDQASIDLAYKVLMKPRTPPSWLYPVTMGATSIWERWDAMLPDGSVNTGTMTSFNHYAYGAVGRWIFENIGGIRIENGGKMVIFQPQPSVEFGITKCKMVYNMVGGRVECRWYLERKKGDIVIEVVVPGNLNGQVVMPSGKVHEITSGIWQFKEVYEKGLDFNEIDDSRMSGEWVIV